EGLGRVKRQEGGFTSAALAADGRGIVGGSGDETAKVWDAPDGKELVTLKGHSEWISSVAFSPDGRRIVTGSADKTARVWDAQDGKQLMMLRERWKGVAAGVSA